MAIRKSKKVAEIKERMQEVVQVKAYEIYKRDNCNDPLRNWLQAEKELSGNK
jgi:hypothetical protein